MKRFGTLLALSFLFLGSATASEDKFGIGLVIGEPTGVSAAYRLGADTMVQGAAAWDLTSPGGATFTADYLYLFNDVLRVENHRIPLYAGIGGKATILSGEGSFDDGDGNLGLSVRVPLGARWAFRGTPLEAFAELVPGLRLFPDTSMDFGGGLGIRWFLDVE